MARRNLIVLLVLASLALAGCQSQPIKPFDDKDYAARSAVSSDARI